MPVALDRIRTPPNELPSCLPQQLLMLRTAAEALDDAGGSTEPARIGALIGKPNMDRQNQGQRRDFTSQPSGAPRPTWHTGMPE